MEKNLAYHRKSYDKSELESDILKENPMLLCKKWFEEVEKTDPSSEKNAMTLSTIDENGFPHNRIVLLKRFNDEGFTFYTNYQSDKGKSIEKNPKVSISFFWPVMERQVIIRGEAKKMDAAASDEYFKTRSRESQIGDCVSNQRSQIENREVLEKRQKE